MGTVNIVHVISTPDVGHSVFATYSEIPDVVFCFTKITQRPDGAFEGDTSVIAEANRPVSDEVARKANEVMDMVFQATMKKVLELAEELPDVE